MKPVKPVKGIRDWANTALYKFIAEEHFRDLLKRNILKLNEGEKRPSTPENLKKIKPEHRYAYTLNPKNESILRHEECQYLFDLYSGQEMDEDPAKHQQAVTTVQLLEANLLIPKGDPA